MRNVTICYDYFIICEISEGYVFACAVAGSGNRSSPMPDV